MAAHGGLVSGKKSRHFLPGGYSYRHPAPGRQYKTLHPIRMPLGKTMGHIKLIGRLALGPSTRFGAIGRQQVIARLQHAGQGPVMHGLARLGRKINPGCLNVFNPFAVLPQSHHAGRAPDDRERHLLALGLMDPPGGLLGGTQQGLGRTT